MYVGPSGQVWLGEAQLLQACHIPLFNERKNESGIVLISVALKGNGGQNSWLAMTTREKIEQLDNLYSANSVHSVVQQLFLGWKNLSRHEFGEAVSGSGGGETDESHRQGALDRILPCEAGLEVTENQKTGDRDEGRDF